MSKSPSLARTTLLVSALAFGTGNALAATVEPVSMADLIQIDALGFSCVEEENLELAFAATGKKDGVIPQSCLPKPCDRLLDTDQLAEYLGRNPTDEKWDEYVSRYAEYCVAETGGPWPDDVLFANASDDIDGFWNGIVLPDLNSGVGSEVATDIVPPGAISQTIAAAPVTPVPVVVPPTIFPPTRIPTIVVPRTRIPPIRIPPIVVPPNVTPATPIVVLPAPVPLPGSMALLFGALGATFITRRVARRAV